MDLSEMRKIKCAVGSELYLCCTNIPRISITNNCAMFSVAL